MRYLICLLFVSGCVMASLPADDSVSADLACETARIVVQMREQIPPTPASDKCDNCGGTGKLGDGRIEVKCPACDGTGKKPKSVCVNCPK
jgi:DnaJ-class molecular chaperone